MASVRAGASQPIAGRCDYVACTVDVAAVIHTVNALRDSKFTCYECNISQCNNRRR